MFVTAIVLLLLGICSVTYFGIYVVLVGLNNTFTWFWLILGLVLVATGGCLFYLHIHGKTLPLLLIRSVEGIVALGLLLFLVTEGLLVGYGKSVPAKDADYMIILGARVKGTKVTANLSRRLDTAYRYLENNPDTKVILSGGQGDGEDISEAEAMAEYLRQKGLDADRMIPEDQSENTWQNIEYSKEKIKDDYSSVVIVTNDFHVFRGTRIAKKQGFRGVEGLGAPTKWYTVPNMFVREAVAVWKYALCGQL